MVQSVSDSNGIINTVKVQSVTIVMSSKILFKGIKKKQYINVLVTLSKLRGEFRTQSNIKNEATYKNNQHL